MRMVIASAMMALFIPVAAQAQTDPPLPPGKPAGVKQAMSKTGEVYLLGGMLVLGLGFALVYASHVTGSSSSAATSTSP